MFEHRPVQPDDFPVICGFPQNEEELFYIYPKGQYPLTPDQLAEIISKRLQPTVVLNKGELIGFANLFSFNEGKSCWLGNFIVTSEYRGTGAAKYLIETMALLARDELKVPYLRLGCHNTNTRALHFYHKLGFTPFRLNPQKNHLGQPVVGIWMERALEEGCD